MNARLLELRERLEAQYDDLSPRDRRLAIALAVLVVVSLVSFYTLTLHRIIADRASRVAEAKLQLGQAIEMATIYGELAGKVEAAEAQMANFQPTQVNTYLERWAATAGVSEGLRGVRETGKQSVGDYTETDYRVEVQRTDLDGIVRFLHAIETSPYPIKVRAATFNTIEAQGERKIDLGLDLAVYFKAAEKPAAREPREEEGG